MDEHLGSPGQNTKNIPPENDFNLLNPDASAMAPAGPDVAQEVADTANAEIDSSQPPVSFSTVSEAFEHYIPKPSLSERIRQHWSKKTVAFAAAAAILTGPVTACSTGHASAEHAPTASSSVQVTNSAANNSPVPGNTSGQTHESTPPPSSTSTAEATPASPQLAKLLKEKNIVQIVGANKGANMDDGASQFGSGVVVLIDGKKYIATDSHVFFDDTASDPVASDKVITSQQPQNIIDKIPHQIGIDTANEGQAFRPVIPVKAIAAAGDDVAIVELDESSAAYHQLDSVPGIPLDDLVQKSDLAPGQGTISMGITYASGNKVAEQAGTVLGTGPDLQKSQVTSVLYVGAEKLLADESNPGVKKGSGGAAVVGNKIALCYRMDYPLIAEGPSEGRIPQELQNDRLRLSHILQRNLASYQQIYAYVLPTRQQILDTIAALHQPAVS